MKFGILGPLEIRDGERLIDVPGGRARKLLAILLLQPNRPVSTEQLLYELWGDEQPGTATKALQGYVSQLRKVLGSDAVETLASGYSLVVLPDALDSQRFEQLLARAELAEPANAAELLREALALWRGPALADFAYDEFARTEIGRLDELQLQAVEARIDADLASGRHGPVVGELEALLTEHPLREHLWGQLMVALYRSGRQAEALSAYASARKKLVDELGIEPGPELQELQRAILTQDASLAAPSPPRRGTGGAVRRLTRPRALAVAGALLLAGAVAVALVELTTGGTEPPTVVPNSVAVVDAKTSRVIGDIPVGSNPIAVAVGAGGVWVTNADDGTVTHIDPKTRKVVKVIGIGGDVSDIAVGFGSVWVANGNEGTLVRINPKLDAIERAITLGGTELEPQPVFQVAVGGGAVWATSGNRVIRVDPQTNRPLGVVPATGPTSVAYGAGAVWVSTLTEQLLRIEPETSRIATAEGLPGPTSSLVTGHGWLWGIVDLGDLFLARLGIWRFAPTTGSAAGTVGVDRPFVDLAVSVAALWAASEDGAVSRIDPESLRAVATVEVGQQPTAIASGDGALWVCITARNGT